MTDTQGNIPETGNAEEIQQSAIPTENKPTEATEPTLPDGVAERTAAEFEKLKQHNAELKSQLDAYKSKTSVLDEFKYPDAPPADMPSTKPSGEGAKRKFVDDQGFVDVERVEEALTAAEERAKRAEEKANSIEKRIQDSEETTSVKATHAEFPELDPHSDKFDPNFYELVKLNLIGQMMNGKKDVLEAARTVRKLYRPAPDVQEVKAEAVNEYKAKVTKRDQAVDNISGRGKGEPSDLDVLREKTRAGDDKALFKRLQASGN